MLIQHGEKVSKWKWIAALASLATTILLQIWLTTAIALLIQYRGGTLFEDAALAQFTLIVLLGMGVLCGYLCGNIAATRLKLSLFPLALFAVLILN
jgi:hypothetical protein